MFREKLPASQEATSIQQFYLFPVKKFVGLARSTLPFVTNQQNRLSTFTHSSALPKQQVCSWKTLSSRTNAPVKQLPFRVTMQPNTDDATTSSWSIAISSAIQPICGRTHCFLLIKANLPRKWLRKAAKKSKPPPKPKPCPNFSQLNSDEDIQDKYSRKVELLERQVNTDSLSLDELSAKITEILNTAGTEVPATARPRSQPWITDEYIKLRKRAYAKTNCNRRRKTALQRLKKLKTRLLNQYFTKRTDEINEAKAARTTEAFFQLARDMSNGPVKKVQQKPDCTEPEFVEHLGTHFRDRNDLPLASELQHTVFVLPQLMTQFHMRMKSANLWRRLNC